MIALPRFFGPTTALLWGLLLVLCVASVKTGAVPVSLERLVQSLSLLVSGAPQALYGMEDRIVLELRLPRVILAMLVGAGLAVVGTLLQTVSRNDLSDPYLFGLSSGSAAGAVAAITFTGEAFGLWSLPLAALAGGLASVAAVLLLLRGYANHSSEQLILAGLSVSFLFTALTYYLTFLGDQRAAQSVLFWTMGGLGGARWDNLFLPSLGVIAVGGFAIFKTRALDSMLAGDHTAHSLGVEPERLRAQTFVVCALATACFVAVSGVIGFVGLMVPHLARARVGALHQRLLGMVMLTGAVLLLGSDLISRTILAPQELPVGIVTAGLGALFVMRIVMRKSEGA